MSWIALAMVPTELAAASDDAAFLEDELLAVKLGPARLVRGRLRQASVDVIVTNASANAVRGPIRVVVDANRLVLNADGRTEDGRPFFEVCASKRCSLDARAQSEPIEVRFRIPSLLERILFRLGRLRFDAAAEYQPFTLQLLHFADVDGIGPLANVRNFSGLLETLRMTHPKRTLFLSSGDNYIPGPVYAAGADLSLAPLVGVPGRGRGDVALLNALGVQASAIGNHELDEGLAMFSGILGVESMGGATYLGAQFPYLSSNIDFAGTAVEPLVVADGQLALSNSVARSAIVRVDGEAIGLVGAAAPTFPQITMTQDARVTPPLLPSGDIDVPALAAEIQVAVDALRSAGVDKIVLLAHMQVLDVERALAPLLREVDIIVGGGSNTILADTNDRIRPGDVVRGTYPEIYTSASGEPVTLVNTDGDYKYLGRQVTAFDLSGRVVLDQLDDTVNGIFATDDTNLQALLGMVPPATAEVDAIADALTDVLAATEGNVFGFTDVYLDGRRATVRAQESNLGNLTADANLFVAKQADPSVTISLKNGGGIRDDIGELVFPPGSSNPADLSFTPPAEIPGIKLAGAISQFDIASALSFNNTLTLVTLTAEQIRALFEHGIGFEGVGTVQQGRFPQVAGVRLRFDPTAPVGNRVLDLTVVDEDTGTILDTLVADGVTVSSASFRMVTLDFLAGGGDGYPFPDLMDPAVNILDLALDPSGLAPGVADFAAPGSEQDALAELLAARFATPDTAYALPEVPMDQDERIVFALPMP